MINDLIFYIGAFDAVLICGLGVFGALTYLFGLDTRLFFERLLPAVGVLVATSAAAGVVMSLAKWMSA